MEILNKVPLDPDFARVERKLNRELSPTEREDAELWWALFSDQFFDALDAANKNGVTIGTSMMKEKFVEWGKACFEKYKQEYSRKGPAGDLKDALKFAEKGRLLYELSQAVEEA